MSVQEFKCPSCGAPIHWNSGVQSMKCEYCDNSYDIDTITEFNEEESKPSVEEYEWDEYNAPGELTDGLAFYVCKSCGGQITAETTTAATHCPYCDSPVVLNNNVTGLLQPDLVIPFKKSKTDAIQAMSDFCKGKPLLPTGFSSYAHLEELKGLYVPFWLFDCAADGKMRYDATRSKSWTEGDYDVTKTDHFMVIREGNAEFDHVPVDGSTNMEDNYMEAIEPFDMNEAVDFNTAYLSGFLADKYDVDSVAAQPRANQRVKNGLEILLRNTVTGYETITTKNHSVFVKNGQIRYAMFPVWILTTKYNGKLYKFAMNGQTGRFVGELPISKSKFAAFLLGITAGIGIVGSIVALLLL